MKKLKENPLFQFKNCWAYESQPGIVELVDELFSYGRFIYRFNKTHSGIYLTSVISGEEKFYKINNKLN